MNKVFKVIWNHATQTWTAVSELGHAKGKTKSKKIVKLTALAGAVLSVVGTAQAAVEVGSSSITIKSDKPAADHTTKGINNINIGTGANTYRNEGNNVVSHDAIAIGTNATGTGDKAVAIGNTANATKENSVALGNGAVASDTNAVAIGQNGQATGNQALAMAADSKASGVQSIAVGSEAKSTAGASIAVGKTALATVDQKQKAYNDAFVKANYSYEWVADKKADNVVKLISNAGGQFEITGLDKGTYGLEETQAPAGYATLSGDVNFEVTATSYSKGATTDIAYDKGSVKKDAQQVQNKKVTIPQTGGIGTILFTIIGLSIMLGAVVIMKKRQSEEA